ncbi:MAG TPA: nucleoside deaminase [Gemmatimonadales bacterium]|nr:nucleoside deaminase [Gemmatimonadales bacterium]
MDLPDIRIELPAWAGRVVDWTRRYGSDAERMRLAIALARANVEEGTGGPFGAAIFERDAGRLVGIGVNSVVRLSNSALHGEMVAFMDAQRRLGSWTLAAPGMPVHELVTSCEPCAMCLGAILWSGVKRVVCGAAREDATRLRFEEGPVFDASYRYLEERGITIVRGVLRDEAREVMELYRARNGPVYNG